MPRNDGATVANAITKSRTDACLELAERINSIKENFDEAVAGTPAQAAQHVREVERGVKDAVFAFFGLEAPPPEGNAEGAQG